MSVRKINFVEGEYFHIYNRGNSKQKIFHDKQDYLYFLLILFISNNVNNFDLNNFSKKENAFNVKRSKEIVAIGAYCLMPNHFHVLITQIEDGGISKFMQKLSTAYAMYYNKKYKRTGSLFEGKFKAEHVDTDVYLKYIFSYIHLNPIKLIYPKWKKEGITNKKEALHYLDSYEYSSYRDFLGKDRKYKNIINIKPFPQYFSKKNSFQKEIMDWINYGE